jgi:hypothetical protein
MHGLATTAVPSRITGVPVSDQSRRSSNVPAPRRNNADTLDPNDPKSPNPKVAELLRVALQA